MATRGDLGTMQGIPPLPSSYPLTLGELLTLTSSPAHTGRHILTLTLSPAHREAYPGYTPLLHTQGGYPGGIYTPLYTQGDYPGGIYPPYTHRKATRVLYTYCTHPGRLPGWYIPYCTYPGKLSGRHTRVYAPQGGIRGGITGFIPLREAY